MSFVNLLTNTVVVLRLSLVTGSTDKRTWATITIEPSNIQQLDAEKTVNIGGAVGKTFKIFADVNADIADGDKLIDEHGIIYLVRAGSISLKTMGSIEHLEGLMERVN